MDQLLYYKIKDASSSFKSRYFISLASNHITSPDEAVQLEIVNCT